MLASRAGHAKAVKVLLAHGVRSVNVLKVHTVAEDSEAAVFAGAAQTLARTAAVVTFSDMAAFGLTSRTPHAEVPNLWLPTK